MSRLVVLWKTSNIVDINELVIPYIYNSMIKKWWDEVEVIIWGDSQNVIASDEKIQNEIKKMINVGVQFHACKKCAESLCVVDQIKQLGVHILYTGELLTKSLQSDAKVITF